MSEVEAIGAQSLSLVSKLAAELNELNSALETKNREAAELSARIEDIETRRLPDAMAELGIKQLVLDGGETVRVKTEFFPAVVKNRESDAYDWLDNNGHGDLIKRELKVVFGKGEEELATKVGNEVLGLVANAAPVNMKLFVHPQTLRGLARELFESGDPLPSDLFGTHYQDRASITKPKETR